MSFIIYGTIIVVCLFFAIKDRVPGLVFLGATFGLFISMALGLAIDGPVNWAQREKVERSYELAALNDGTTSRGSFFLGTGSIDSVPSFMYYAKQDNGYRLYDWPASRSEVVETDDTPRVVFYCDDYSKVTRPFRWPVRMITSDGSYIDCDHAFATFYVPPGSVKQQYYLDAK